MIPDAAIYEGTLRHRRHTPRRHEFTYSLFMAWLNVEAIPSVMAKSPLTGYNRFRWASFHDADHFGNPKEPLLSRVRANATQEGASEPRGPVYVLTHLRYLGYCFNPISFYFSDRPLMAEVTSTFGESCNYWFGAHNALAAGNSWRFLTGKRLHVSPFLPMDLTYRFTLTSPAETFTAHVEVMKDREPAFDATLTLRRREWSTANLARVLARHPFMTGKVMAAIHWEALRLWAKGVPVIPRPRSRKEVA